MHVQCTCTCIYSTCNAHLRTSYYTHTHTPHILQILHFIFVCICMYVFMHYMVAEHYPSPWCAFSISKYMYMYNVYMYMYVGNVLLFHTKHIYTCSPLYSSALIIHIVWIAYSAIRLYKNACISRWNTHTCTCTYTMYIYMVEGCYTYNWYCTHQHSAILMHEALLFLPSPPPQLNSGKPSTHNHSQTYTHTTTLKLTLSPHTLHTHTYLLPSQDILTSFPRNQGFHRPKVHCVENAPWNLIIQFSVPYNAMLGTQMKRCTLRFFWYILSWLKICFVVFVSKVMHNPIHFVWYTLYIHVGE